MIAAVELLVILLCMVGQAFFAGIETGVISIHRMRLRHVIKQGSSRAVLLQELLGHRVDLQGSVLADQQVTMSILQPVSPAGPELHVVSHL